MSPRTFERAGPKAATSPLTQRLRQFTPAVAFVTIYTSAAMFNFGYDVGVFSGLQAMPQFKQRFGKCDAQGTCAIPSYLTSVMNSTPYLGKLVGSWVAAPMSEHLGRKKTLMFIAIASIFGTVVQISATTAAQFTVGRIVCYFMTGICMLNVPAYLAETAPADLRGLMGGQPQIQIMLSQVIASLINFGTQGIDKDACWMIPIGIQFIMPMVLITTYPFLVESPRWLLSRERTDEALKALKKLRKKCVSNEAINQELSMLVAAPSNEGKGNWKDVFTGVNKRRTCVAVIGMLGQQMSGQIFLSQYSILFYQKQGYTNSFELGIIYNVLQMACALFTSVVVDSLGRRPLLICGGIGQAAFMYVVGGIGTIANPNPTQKNTLVAGLLCFGISFGLAWAPLSYVTMSEAPSRRVVEKTSMLATSLSVLVAFVVSFTVPYLVNAEGAKVGFLYGSTSMLMAVLAFLFVPEMKGRSLEELDKLFQQRTPTCKFKDAVINPQGTFADGVSSLKRNQAENIEHVGVDRQAVPG